MRIFNTMFALALALALMFAAPLAGAAAPLKLEHAIELRAQTVSTPVIAQGKLYIGAEDGNLYAYDLASRKLAWLYHAGAGIGSTPAVADGAVYVLARDGRLHAVDAQTGVLRWEFSTQGEAHFAAYGLYGSEKKATPTRDPWDFWLSSPVVADGRVYFGSSDERLYALDAKTGAVHWAFKSGGMIHAAPALAGKCIVFGSWDGAVYVLDADSGKQRWRYQTETEQKTSTLLGVQAQPLVDGDTVYIGSRDSYFYALDLASGKMKWRYNGKGSWVISGAVADAQHVYFGTSDTNLLVGLDKRSGQPLFEHDTKVWTYATPLLAGRIVYGASMRGELFALDATTGKLQWSWRTPESLADDFGLLDASTGKFNGQRLFEGPQSMLASLEHVKKLGAFMSTPVWHEGQLIAATADGRILFFR
ncbi:Outer membrane protein assembly factor BamB, contains PQQ-like beta-propeller repeat [Duganella sp. CF458]|uniref:PQQ-binding-like beta-propeller repeat protein n=1 Tax=Duganella sp. CF458 TaxID=1884368 RepID=UPI0008E8BCFC|nr:PQQ-binding-like beta-propeller repeat protein [Duganella sp. CF458]SFG60562.1 Outer membrane protein assembly factor BamB, contains PQQ-like beta-propeller repeat [Duganella sp. CF458]